MPQFVLDDALVRGVHNLFRRQLTILDQHVHPVLVLTSAP